MERDLADRPARLMLWEAEPAAETRERLEALEIELIVFRPCGSRPGSGDFLSVISENAAAVERARP